MNEAMIDNALEPNEPEKRKIGIVADFRTCGEEYLSLISSDLRLDATPEQMRILQEVFISLGRDPLVTELYFSYAALLRAQRNAVDNIRLCQAENCSPDIVELLSAFINRYRIESTDNNLPYLTNLAEFAATGKAKQTDCGIYICETDNLTFPLPYSGNSETVTAGKYSITLSSGKPLSGNKTGDVCVLIAPKNGDDTDTFIHDVSLICRRFLKEYPDTKIVAATERGFLYDIYDFSEGWLIDTSLFPEPSSFAESVFLSFAPSLILFPPREALPTLWEISSEYGITPSAPAATRTKFISVKAAESSVEFDKSFFDHFKQETHISIRHLDNSFIDGNGYLPINSGCIEYKLTTTPHIITARNVGGCNLYEDLACIMSDTEAVYAITGTINPDDGLFLKSIITLDSFRRNNNPEIVYSRFFIGDKTSITVIKLKSEK